MALAFSSRLFLRWGEAKNEKRERERKCDRELIVNHLPMADVPGHATVHDACIQAQ
jgi:hypothetical protein